MGKKPPTRKITRSNTRRRTPAVGSAKDWSWAIGVAKGWADTFESASRKRTAGERIAPPPPHGDQERLDEPHEEVLDIDIVSEVDAF